MADLLSAVLRGMTFGSVYGLLAVGLVLTFKTSGVFNLAYGAQAYTTAAVYFDTRIRHHWPIPLAVLLAVVIVAPLTGLILDRLLFRHLRTASSTARLVTVLGLLVAIPQAVDLWFGAANTQRHRRGARRPEGLQPVEGCVPLPRRHRDDRRSRSRSCSGWSCCSGTPRSGCACAPSSRARG